MRELLAVAVILAIFIFFLPVILGFVLMVLCAAAVFLLLVRFGLLPGATYRRYTFGTRGGRGRRTEARRGEDAFYASTSGWYQEEQDGEIVTLPEGSLKKDKDKF